MSNNWAVEKFSAANELSKKTVLRKKICLGTQMLIFGQVIWGFKENLRGECQKLMKIVKIKTIKWIQKRPTNLNVLQGLGFITYACFISIHAYSDHESPKKAYDLHFEKTLNWKFQNFVSQDPTKRQHTDTRDTSIVLTCATSFVYHPLGVYAREAGACEEKILQENWF